MTLQRTRIIPKSVVLVVGDRQREEGGGVIELKWGWG